FAWEHNFFKKFLAVSNKFLLKLWMLQMLSVLCEEHFRIIGLNDSFICITMETSSSTANRNITGCGRLSWTIKWKINTEGLIPIYLKALLRVQMNTLHCPSIIHLQPVSLSDLFRNLDINTVARS